MSKDWLDELEDEPEAQKAEAAPSEQEQPEQLTAEAKQPEAEAPGEPEAEAEEGSDENSPPDDDRPVNQGQLAALLAEREKRQQFEREREQARQESERYKRELEELRQSQQQTQNKNDFPDPIDDPQGYRQAMQREAQQAALSAKLELSEDHVRQTEGDEVFEAAQAWWREAVQKQPHLLQEGLKQRNPWRYAVNAYKRDQVMSEIGEDPTAYKERLRQELLAELQSHAQPGATAEPRPKASPPPSLAKGGAGGTSEGIADLSEEEFFASTFKR